MLGVDVFSSMGENAEAKMSQSEKYSADGESEFIQDFSFLSTLENKTGVLLWSLFIEHGKAFVFESDSQGIGEKFISEETVCPQVTVSGLERHGSFISKFWCDFCGCKMIWREFFKFFWDEWVSCSFLFSADGDSTNGLIVSCLSISCSVCWDAIDVISKLAKTVSLVSKASKWSEEEAGSFSLKNKQKE